MLPDVERIQNRICFWNCIGIVNQFHYFHIRHCIEKNVAGTRLVSAENDVTIEEFILFHI